MIYLFQFYLGVMIASAHDFTYEFSWIRNDKARDEMIQGIGNMTNSTQNGLSTPLYQIANS